MFKRYVYTKDGKLVLEIMFELLMTQTTYHEIFILEQIAYTDCHLQKIFHLVSVACFDKLRRALSIKPKYLYLSNGFALVELFFKCLPLYQYLRMTYFVNCTQCEK